MEKNITLISADNQKIEIDFTSAKKSGLLKEKMLTLKKGELKLPDIKYDLLKRIVQYLSHYKNKNPREIQKPTRSSNLSDIVDEWDEKFINDLDLDDVFELINAATYMKIQSLSDLACTKISTYMKDRPTEEIQAMFSTPCDLTAEEIKQYKQLEL